LLRSYVLILLVLVVFGCQKSEEVKPETNSVNPPKTLETAKNEIDTPEVRLPIDVLRLTNKTIDEVDKILGKPEEAKPTRDNGEYRLYKVFNEPKGLAVRFYDGQAKSFNLILTKPFSSSKEAIKKVFNIDVGKILPTKDTKEPLSEKYRGTFGGVKFNKISAKKDEKGNGFIFVLAEIER
jgi:hypothetical protein